MYSGNVGIKTDTPTSGTLHINGNVFANSYTGSLLGTASRAVIATTASYSTTLAAGIGQSYGDNTVNLASSNGTILGYVTINNVSNAGYANNAGTANNIVNYGAATVEQINIGELNNGNYAYIVRAQELEQSKHATHNIYNNLNFI